MPEPHLSRLDKTNARDYDELDLFNPDLPEEGLFDLREHAARQEVDEALAYEATTNSRDGGVIDTSAGDTGATILRLVDRQPAIQDQEKPMRPQDSAYQIGHNIAVWRHNKAA